MPCLLEWLWCFFFLILIFHLLQNFRDVVLEHLYQSFSDDEGGVQGCIREALLSHPEMDRATTVKVGAAPNLLVLVIMCFPSLFFLFLQKKFFSSVCLCCRDWIFFMKIETNACKQGFIMEPSIWLKVMWVLYQMDLYIDRIVVPILISVNVLSWRL